VRAALALAMLGAGEETRAEFGQVLFGLSEGAENAEQVFAEALQQLLKPNEQAREDLALTLATSLWASPRFAPVPAFIAQAHARYKAEAAALDFTAPTAAATINQWVQQHTQGRIATVVSAEELQSAPPEILLLNAVYFRAHWASPFPVYSTRPGPFRQANGNQQEVSFMHQVSSDIGYLAGKGFQAVALPYRGFAGRFSMCVFLPDQLDGLPAFVASLTPKAWTKWQQSFTKPEELDVDLTLPRFRLEWSTDLVPMLRQLGLTTPFAPGADFTPMGFRAEEGGGYIASVRHKTFLEVDEAGTKAAAVTALMMVAGSAPPAPKRRVAVKVDSPFFYAIVDNRDGALLFAGTANDLSRP
jgi:serpin B